jgi:HK97 family phage portal protein
LISETIGSLPLRVYQGINADKKERRNAWQWNLLCERPNDEQSPFDFWNDVSACLEGYGNAYIFKVAPTAGAVDELHVLDPEKMQVGRNRQGQKVFWWWTGDERLELTSAEILHIRGPVLKGGDCGVSPIALCRNAIGTALDRTDYEGYFYQHNASPGGALIFPDRVGRDKALEAVRLWSETHGGPGNAGLPAVLSGGSDWKNIGVPLRDAQFIEANSFSVEDVARMFNIPAAVLSHAGRGASVEEDARRFLNFSLRLRLKRITDAVRHDTDLFGRVRGDGRVVPGVLYPQFFTDEFIMADAVSISQVRHNYIQDGVLVDEVRAQLGLEPLPNGQGKIPQLTPVGGAPNNNQQQNPPVQEPADSTTGDTQA